MVILTAYPGQAFYAGEKKPGPDRIINIFIASTPYAPVLFYSRQG
jgi:hypothetical protein